MPCTVCQHPQRQDIDQALMSGGTTLAALSQQHNLSTSALHRHQAHLQAKVGRAKAKLLEHLQQGCIFWLSQALEMTMQTAQAAQADGNGKVVLRAISQGTRLVNIILKNDFPLDDNLVFEVLASPQWATQASLLPNDPQILTAGRQALTGELSSPCPDSEDADQSPASLEDLDALQALISTLAQPPAAPTKTANRLANKREKSGKLPGKTPCDEKITMKYQGDMLQENNTGKITQACRPEVGGPGILPGQTSSGSLLESLAAGRLDFNTLNAIGAGRRLPEPLAVFKDALSPVTPEISGNGW